MSTSADPSWTVDDLPLLGEAFAVEFANTHYRSDREDLDFLADAAGIAIWFRHAPAAAVVTPSQQIPPATAAAIRRVRDATRLLLAEAADDGGSLVRAQAAEVLHQETRRAPAHLALDLSGGAPSWHLHHDGREEDIFVAGVASQCILFLGGEDAGRVRRCARPACPMFFVQRHRARRFCDETCAHSVRQARYYRSTATQRQPRKST